MENNTLEIPALTKELVALAQSGDRKAIDHVIVNCKGSTVKLANQLYKAHCQKLSVEVDDIVQEANIQFYKAIKYYDIEQFNPGGFINFCLRKVNWRIRDRLRGYHRECALEFTDHVNDITATKELELPCFVIEKVKAIMAKQPVRNSRIWFEYYEEGMLAKDTKSRYGISTHHCKVIIRKLDAEIIKACA